MEKNYYELLGVSRNADIVEIKKRYRLLAGLHHPDKPNGNKLIFSQISIAFDTLKNEIKRRNYDSNLSYNERIERENREREEIERRAREEQIRNENLRNQKKEKENVINYKTNYNSINIKETNIVKSKPLHVIQNLTIKESQKGCIKKIVYDRIVTCKVCKGVGYGVYNNAQVECPNCLGTGQKIKEEHIKVEIKPNTIVGRTLTLKNLGNETKDPRMENGDLIIQIDWNGNWTSKGNDIYTEVNIKNKDLKNKFFDFKNFNRKKIRVFIPDNINDGQIIKLSQKGWKEFKSDLFIKVNINKSFFQKIKEKFSQ